MSAEDFITPNDEWITRARSNIEKMVRRRSLLNESCDLQIILDVSHMPSIASFHRACEIFRDLKSDQVEAYRIGPWRLRLVDLNLYGREGLRALAPAFEIFRDIM